MSVKVPDMNGYLFARLHEVTEDYISILDEIEVAQDREDFFPDPDVVAFDELRQAERDLISAIDDLPRFYPTGRVRKDQSQWSYKDFITWMFNIQALLSRGDWESFDDMLKEGCWSVTPKPTDPRDVLIFFQDYMAQMAGSAMEDGNYKDKWETPPYQDRYDQTTLEDFLEADVIDEEDSEEEDSGEDTEGVCDDPTDPPVRLLGQAPAQKGGTDSTGKILSLNDLVVVKTPSGQEFSGWICKFSLDGAEVTIGDAKGVAYPNVPTFHPSSCTISCNAWQLGEGLVAGALVRVNSHGQTYLGRIEAEGVAGSYTVDRASLDAERPHLVFGLKECNLQAIATPEHHYGLEITKLLS